MDADVNAAITPDKKYLFLNISKLIKGFNRRFCRLMNSFNDHNPITNVSIISTIEGFSFVTSLIA
ncbi:hypothetical protein NIT62_03785 [Mammaliicoccus sciuri]|nr:hypothetical protein NIT62_03785 [Mammaliicoccus sciuri]